MSGALVTLAGVALAAVLLVVWGRRDRSRRLPATYAEDLRLFRGNGRKIWLSLAALAFVGVPVGMSWLGYKGAHLPAALLPGVPFDEKWLFVMCQAGIFAIGAIGLNLLIGNTGQISLGHSAFLALGAFALTYFGKDVTVGGRHLHAVLWLAIAMVLGALVSAAIGPFALRLRGNYLAVVSLSLVFFGEHLVKNWDSVTGGSAAPRADLPPLYFVVWPGEVVHLRTPDTGETDFFGTFFFSDKAGYFWVIWLLVAVCAWLASNVLRSRQGRAMMAVRDRDLSAEVIGVRQMYTKTWAFALSGAFAALAGALYGSFYGFASAESFGLALSIQFVAMIIVGGVGSVLGSVLGGVVVAALPEVIKQSQGALAHLPFIQSDPAKTGLTLDRLTLLIYGVFIVAFLMFFPQGLAGLWLRLKRWFQTWPFST